MTMEHTINLLNTTYTVPSFSMTIDQALIYQPFLSAQVNMLGEIKLHLPKA